METSRVNILYFGLYFLLLVLLSTSSIFTKESLGGSSLFFFLYALGQILVEMAFLILIPVLLQKYVGKIAAKLFIGLTFFAVFIHIFDYLMDRILDLSVWEAFRIFVLQESFENFFYLLDASGISFWVWLLFFAFLTALPFLGIFFYHMTDKIVQKWKFALSPTHFLQIALCVPVALFLWDFSASHVIEPDAYTAFCTSLPWKRTFLQPQNALLNLPDSLKNPAREKEIEKDLAQDQTVLAKKPNIYLFITESLREDCITPAIAPHLSQFKEKAFFFDQAIASGNGTHLSWFSIFHSQHPFYWKQFQTERKMGSPVLKLLKKWGYQVRLYSSAQLSYYGMEELLFGQKAYLLDSKQTFHHAPPESAADSDKAALAKLQQDLKEHPEYREGQIFIVFWDCTHFNYNWPKSWSPKFTPFAQEFTYFRMIQSEKTIQAIRNRYHSAVNYMDHLFGRFLDQVEEEAIVIFTGDHGEEFFDHGHLFHNSHLTQEQIHIPLFLKFGSGMPKRVFPQTISQIDIFPSVIDYLAGKSFAFLEGHSIFRESPFPYTVTTRFNAGNTPYEFSIQNGKNKLIAQFSNRNQVFEDKQLKIVSLRTKEDKATPLAGDVNAWIQQEFGEAFKHLFKTP